MHKIPYWEDVSFYSFMEAPVRYDDSLSAEDKLLYLELTATSREGGIKHPLMYYASVFKVPVQDIEASLERLESANHIRVRTENGKKVIFLGGERGKR